MSYHIRNFFTMYLCIQVLNSMTPHEDFRLWLTAEPHQNFPLILLQSSLKVTYEVKSLLFSSINQWLHLYINVLFSPVFSGKYKRNKSSDFTYFVPYT